MSSPLPPCPYLPRSDEAMDWRNFTSHGEERGAEFYLTALKYGHYLWQRGLAARGVLCLDRAFGANLQGDEAVLQNWPMPYAAMAWFLTHTPPTIFIGNPRVHFQHYAGRMNEPRREQRRWRAWACWALTRAIMPHLPPDLKHEVEEPALAQIAQNLDVYGFHGESESWRRVLAERTSLATGTRRRGERPEND